LAERELIARGDDHLEQGDIASARLFYERAADAGDGRAARRLGNTFDPSFLARLGARFMRGDADVAARWYRRAGALGDTEAAQDLAALQKH
jgi:TPR repeat protein